MERLQDYNHRNFNKTNKINPKIKDNPKSWKEDIIIFKM